ncbi:hypothetical protein ACM26W_20610 [Halomonas sp. HK25]|uniref:hypothetical protein n=1 Tax=Halomonas sp. HK25 TaxID=3394321 RepID=UPI0039FCC8D7
MRRTKWTAKMGAQGCRYLAQEDSAGCYMMPRRRKTATSAIPAELFTKFQASFYAKPVDAVVKAQGVE